MENKRGDAKMIFQIIMERNKFVKNNKEKGAESEREREREKERERER